MPLGPSDGIMDGIVDGMLDGGSDGTCEGPTEGGVDGLAEGLKLGVELGVAEGAIVGVRLGAELMEGVKLIRCNATSLGALALAGGAVPVSIMLVLGKDTGGFWLGIIGVAKIGEELGAGDSWATGSSIKVRGVLFLGAVLLGAFVGTLVGFSISRP